MKKTNVISGASVHQVALSSDQRLAGSSRVSRQPATASGSTAPRRKRPAADLDLKNSSLEPIHDQTNAAMGADLESRIRQLEQATQNLRAELVRLTKASKDKG